MTGDITFKDCGWKQPNGTASLSSQGTLVATRLHSKRNENWALDEVLNYQSLKAEFVRRMNPEFEGTLSAETSNTQFRFKNKISFNSNSVTILELSSNPALYANLDMDNNRIRYLGTPISDGDAATKKYVDEHSGGGGGGGGFTAHLGDSSGMERGAIVLSSRNVLSIVL